MARRLTAKEFEQWYPYAIHMLRRAIDRGPPLNADDRADLQQTLALKILRWADATKIASEYQFRAYLKTVARTVWMDFMKTRQRTEQVVTATAAEVLTEPTMRDNEALKLAAVRVVFETFPRDQIAVAAEPIDLQGVLPESGRIRKQRQRAREKLAPVIQLHTGCKIVNKT